MLERKKRDDEDNENLDRWLLTYADMITLLLAFFIVMYSISRVDMAKFNKVAEALNIVLDGSDKNAQATMGDLKGFIKDHPRKGDLINLQARIDEISQQKKLGMEIKTDLQKRGLVIHISEATFFDLGKAELKPQAMEILDLLAVELLKAPNHIRVEGHTDNLPISTPKYPSNWELSTARATTCLRYLIEKNNFPPERISALGYAEYRPIATNTTAEGRNKNRRVDIIVLAPDDASIEPINQTGENTKLPNGSSANKAIKTTLPQKSIRQ
jgi:chemotaxis protein MotB